MNDFRITTNDQLREVVEKNHSAGARSHLSGYVTGGIPSDRRGLISAMHDQAMLSDRQVQAWHKLAKELAKQSKQRVYVVMTTSRWHLLLFSIEIVDDDGEPAIWYDEEEDGKYANDQYIAHYDPDGTFQLDGAS